MIYTVKIKVNLYPEAIPCYVTICQRRARCRLNLHVSCLFACLQKKIMAKNAEIMVKENPRRGELKKIKRQKG